MITSLDSLTLTPLFREFIQKYKSTLEISAANGRSILPKPPTFTPHTDVKPTPPPAPPLTMEPILSRGPFIGNSMFVPPLAMDTSITGTHTLPSCPMVGLTQTVQGLKTLPPVMSIPQPSSHLAKGSGVRDVGPDENQFASKVSAMNTVLNVQNQATYVEEMLQKVSAESAVNLFEGQWSIGGGLPETQKSSPAVNLTCTEALPVEGYSKLHTVDYNNTTAHLSNDVLNIPQNKPSTSYQPMSTKSNLNPTPTESEVQPSGSAGNPVDLTSAILSSLVNQKPIPTPVESTSKSAPKKFLLPKVTSQAPQLKPTSSLCDLKGLSPSAILAGQIVTCLQPNTSQLNHTPTTLLPISQLSSIFSLPSLSPASFGQKFVPSQSGSVRVPLGVVQGQGRVPVSLSGKNRLKEDSGKENEISPPKKLRLA